jgi:hypothetical protein
MTPADEQSTDGEMRTQEYWAMDILKALANKA